MIEIGLVINPLAGLGGSVALKGSDGAAVVREALRRGAVPHAEDRSATALRLLLPWRDQIHFTTWAGEMGANCLERLGFAYRVAGAAPAAGSNACDTREAAAALQAAGVDVLVFAGGDGTARDVLDGLRGELPVLGIPAGVKMHSGVYAVSPNAAGELLALLVQGKLVDLRRCEVRDIDEQALRQGRLVAGFYGEMLVPEEGRFVQQVKQSGREVEELVLQDIAAEVVENMDPDTLYLIGPGTTTRAVMDDLGLASTLLGIDAVLDSALLAADATEAGLLALLQAHSGPACIILTVTGGQGSLLGRGNQQISPAVLGAVGPDHLLILATKTKISELAGRPLLVDTGDRALDEALSGYRPVITGYRDRILYPVATHY